MSGIGTVPESVDKRSVTSLTQSPSRSNLSEDSRSVGGSSTPVELVQVNETPGEELVRVSDTHERTEELDNDGGQCGGESSEGEGDVEIEHIGDEGNLGNQDVEHYIHDTHTGTSIPDIPVTFDVRKRTLIAMWQRTILEDLYQNGMTSASLQLAHLHVTGAQRTGLDVSVVKNWIRNRRRPTAIRSAEKLAEKMSVGNTLHPITGHSIPALTSIAPPVASVTQGESSPHGHHTHPHLQTHTSSPLTGYPPTHSLPPEPKRICIDSGSQPQQHHTPSAPSTHHHHSSPQATAAAGSGSTHTHPVVLSINHVSPASRPVLIVKLRVCGSGEQDFIEVEVPSLTYSALLKACCEELDVSSSEVAKIRKLPNVLVRKDRDVQRMKEGQELEVVLKSENSTITSMLTVNPFSAAGGGNIPLLNIHPSSVRNDTENSIIAALANEVPTSIHELSETGGSHTVNGHGLH